MHHKLSALCEERQSISGYTKITTISCLEAHKSKLHRFHNISFTSTSKLTYLFFQLYFIESFVSPFLFAGYISYAFVFYHMKTAHVDDLTLLYINPLNAHLNPIRHLLALLGAHHIFHVGRIGVNSIIIFREVQDYETPPFPFFLSFSYPLTPYTTLFSAPKAYNTRLLFIFALQRHTFSNPLGNNPV
jgi:hypothetical protein